MIELIATIILLISLCGILFILYRKVPVLAQLPLANGKAERQNFLMATEDKIKDIYLVFFKQKLLHKLLSWLKIMTLKVETKIDSLLHGIRKEKLSKKKEAK